MLHSAVFMELFVVSILRALHHNLHNRNPKIKSMKLELVCQPSTTEAQV
jgi:hypothetical protein